MLRDSVEGMERVMDSDVPEGSVVLIIGAEGCLKSGLVFNAMVGHLSKAGGHGLYASLEQTRESHLNNMGSLGIPIADGLHIFDYRDMRMEWAGREPDMVKMTEETLGYFTEKYGEGLKVFALDSLNALYALSDPSNPRKSMYSLFTGLKDAGMTSLLVVETPRFSSPVISIDSDRPEHFLADGVIELGALEGPDGVKRYIQIRKMRGVRHKMEKHHLVVGKNGLSILGPIY